MRGSRPAAQVVIEQSVMILFAKVDCSCSVDLAKERRGHLLDSRELPEPVLRHFPHVRPLGLLAGSVSLRMPSDLVAQLRKGLPGRAAEPKESAKLKCVPFKLDPDDTAAGLALKVTVDRDVPDLAAGKRAFQLYVAHDRGPLEDHVITAAVDDRLKVLHLSPALTPQAAEELPQERVPKNVLAPA